MNFDKELENQRISMDRQEIEVYCYCERCGKEIYKNEDYYYYEKDKLCEECFDEIQHDEKFNCRRIAGDYDEQ